VVSEFTAPEAVELPGVDERRVRVIPHGVDERFAPEGLAANGAYPLALGTVEPLEESRPLAEAARAVGEVASRGGSAGLGGVGVKPVGFVDDLELARLYRGTAYLVYPSLYEGFGLPVLEAMASSTPVVTATGTAPAELADGAAVLVDPAGHQCDCRGHPGGAGEARGAAGGGTRPRRGVYLGGGGEGDGCCVPGGGRCLAS
jgi:glycosyltransferase involved in cell wall biosynthesis